MPRHNSGKSLIKSLLKTSQKKNIVADRNFKVDIEEFRKCAHNAEYFVKNYCAIFHPTRGKLKFDMYDFQTDILKGFQNHRCNVVLKGRQEGISTLVAAYMFWMMLFKPPSVIVVMAHRESTSKSILHKIRYMVQELERDQKRNVCKNVLPWPWKNFIKKNVKSIVMPNHSTCIAEAASEDPARGEGATLLVVDEAAIIDNLAAKWSALAPIITTGGSAIVCSTPRGAVGKFYTLCTDAKLDEEFVKKYNVKPTCSASNNNGFNLSIAPYYIVPGRDEAWLNAECKKMGYDDRQRAEEYLAEFLASGDTFLPPGRISKLSGDIVEPKKQEGPGGNVWVWEDPIDGCNYLLVADVAEGASADYSGCHMIKVETGDVVMEYKGKISVHDYAVMLVEYGDRYNTAGIAVERTGPGIAVLEVLHHTIKYPKIYYTPIVDDINNIKRSQRDKDKAVRTYFFNPLIDLYINGKPGFLTNQSTRPQMLNKLSVALTEGTIKIKSHRLMDELKTFIYDAKKQRYQAASGCNDDLVMSLAIASYVYDIAVKEFNLNQEYITSMLSAATLRRKGLPDHLGSHNLYAEQNIYSQNTVKTKEKLEQMHQIYQNKYVRYVNGRMVNLLDEFGFNE